MSDKNVKSILLRLPVTEIERVDLAAKVGGYKGRASFAREALRQAAEAQLEREA